MLALPNLAERHLADAIRLIGQPGFESTLWSLFSTAVAPDNLLALVYRDAGPPQILYSQTYDPTVFARLNTTYLPGAYRLDPFFDLHLQRAPAGAYRLLDVAPDAFLRSRYFSQYYEQTTLIDEVTFVAYPAPGVSLNLCLGRDASSARPYAEREIATCHRLAPIIEALATAHWSTLAHSIGPAEDTGGLLARAAYAAHGIHLSPRQAEVALLILRGHSTASIALRLGVSPQTVKVFRRQLYSRCAISSQAELFALMVPMFQADEGPRQT